MNNVEWRIEEGLVEYPEAISFMESRIAAIECGTLPELVWCVEHPPLYTAGSSAKSNDLLTPNRFPVYSPGRGGEYTYHGPGQRICYVMLNLKARQSQDIRAYVRNLEQWIINTLERFAIKGERREGRVGIWVQRDQLREDKIAAIGIRVRKWITYHGIALNIETDLSHYEGIVPCGIQSHGVTSFHDLGHLVTMEEVDSMLKDEFDNIFGGSD